MSGQWQPDVQDQCTAHDDLYECTRYAGHSGPHALRDIQAAMLDVPTVLSAQDVVDRAAYRKARRRELAVVLGAAAVAGGGIVAILWTVLHNVVVP